MKVLLSIKPEFAEKIFDGTKRYEFRRSIFKEENITKVIVYASSPLQQVIGEFEIADIFSLNPKALWKKTKRYSGISEKYFFNYFYDKEIGHAIKIKNVKRYRKPLSLKENFNTIPPQSFSYIR